MAKIQQFYTNYASLKARGVGENITYIYTGHKFPVKMSGFETSENVKNAMAVYSSKIGESENNSRFENNIVRAKNNVIQLVANNDWEFFVTLTLDKDKINRFDLKNAKKKISQFLTNYSKRSGATSDFKYLLIPEFHKDGAVHFHGVFKGINKKDLVINKYGYFDFVPYCKAFGFCSLGAIQDLSKCAYYMTKYLTKDMFLNQTLEKGTHLYFASKGLKKDKTIIKGHSVIGVDEFIKKGIIPYENQFCVKVNSDDLETCKDWVLPFGKQFKTGVNVKINKLSDNEKIRLKKIQVCKYKNLEKIKGNFNLDKLWNLIFKEFAQGLTDYEIQKRKFEELKKQLNFVKEKQELSDNEIKEIENVFNNYIKEFEIKENEFKNFKGEQLKIVGG